MRMSDHQPHVEVCDDWEYPPVRLPDGTNLTSEQVRALVVWYWENGQGYEDVFGSRKE